MKDAGIQDGDLLVVDRSAKPVNGSVVVVAVNGDYTVKRLRRGPECVWLDPANPRIPQMPYVTVSTRRVLRSEEHTSELQSPG